MAIIVGDIHGRRDKAQAFLSYRPDAGHVALGDYLDSFTVPAEQQLECLRLLMASPSVLLLGNHDLHYLNHPLFQFPGYNEPWADEFNLLLEANIDRFQPSCVVDGWLCTHAGVSPWLAGSRSVVELDQLFNEAWQTYLVDRAGGYRYKLIFTFDFMGEGIAVPDSIRQIHGHDELSDARLENLNCVSIGCNDSGTCWVFDTETGEIANLL